MANRTWIILDVHYLCWRAFYTTGHLSFREVKTGVIYGVMRDIFDLHELFHTTSIAFCFDSRKSKRKELFPKYKAKRHGAAKDDEEVDEALIQTKLELVNQIENLRLNYLPRMGYKNIFCSPGYESDDIMASIAMNAKSSDDIFLITADNDMLQCLDDNVSIYNPHTKKTTTVMSFMKEWKVNPSKWPVVKCIAGCKTDEVPGVKGVGEKTAVKFIRNELKQTTKAYRAIVSQNGKTIRRRNAALVTLPFEGTPLYELWDDKLSKEGWREVAQELGIKSLKP